MFKFSQRSFSTLIVIVAIVLTAIYAGFNHLLPNIHDLAANFITVLTPFILVMTTLSSWLDTIDNMVANSTLKPGDIPALFSLSPFWIAMVTCLSGIFQMFGIKVIDPDTQALLVNAALLTATIVLRSFSNRAPQSPTTTLTVTAIPAESLANIKVTIPPGPV